MPSGIGYCGQVLGHQSISGFSNSTASRMPRMPLIQTAEAEDVARLLSLYPASKLREVWPQIEGRKEDICKAIADQPAARGQVITFIGAHFTCCRQRVYVFARPPGAVVPFPAMIGEAERVSQTPAHSALYLVRTTLSAILSEPFERVEIGFLWPFRLELGERHFLVRMVTLEKNLSSYVDRPHYGVKQDIDEEALLSDVLQIYQFGLTDLHQGVKAAWRNDAIDATRVKYKKPHSTASEAMDEERGIKAHNRDLYDALAHATLFQTTFKVLDRSSVSLFVATPAEGLLIFPRQSETVGDSDALIQRILEENQ
jgi:hypothetical protein